MVSGSFVQSPLKLRVVFPNSHLRLLRIQVGLDLVRTNVQIQFTKHCTKLRVWGGYDE